MMKLWNLCWQTIVNWNRKLLVGYMKEIDYGEYFTCVCFGEGELDKFLGTYGKANDFLDAYNKYTNVVEWVEDCLNIIL